MATVLRLLQFHWQKQWRHERTRLLQRGVAYTLIAAVAGLYVGWIGLVFPETLAKNGVQEAPHEVLNEHLLSVFAALVVLRFLLQRSVGQSWRPALVLPVGRKPLARALQLHSALSLLTLLPLVGVGALATSTIAPTSTTAGTALWTVGAMLMIAATHVANVGLRTAWRLQRWAVIGGAAVGIVGLIGADILGIGGVRAASAWLFGGLQAGAVLPMVVLAAATVGLGLASTAALRRWTYDWVEGGAEQGTRSGPMLSAGGWDSLSSLVLLEAKLILRNRGPREQVFAGVITIGAFAAMMTGGERLAAFKYVMAPLFFGQLLTVGYGQFLFAWHGAYFDGLLLHRSSRQLVRAALVVLLIFAVGPALAALPVVLWAEPFLAVPMLAFAVYNAGVAVPLVGWAAVRWNRRWVNPEQSRFSWFGGGPVRGLVFFFLLCAPPIWMSVRWSLPAVLGSVAGIGLVGLGTIPFWLPRLELSLRRQRHAVLRGFRGPWLPPDTWTW